MVIILLTLVLGGFYYLSLPHRTWPIQSIDTMKSSRDLSRVKLNDPSFDVEIDRQVRNIREVGANFIAIGTPYDAEFLPHLRRWVAVARKYKLHVWFRGNFSGWEKWFDYKPITREQHLRLTGEFILNNKDLFQDGDIFSSCPECENGGPGDPRSTGDLSGFRQFLINEYSLTAKSFVKIGKNVSSNFNSMNYDVARLTMDKSTTEALDGVVVIDHYVPEPEQLTINIDRLSSSSGGKVFIGEFGVPIPDLHGNLSDSEQATWIKKALDELAKDKNIIGINYWVNTGGSTQLWDEAGYPREAVSIIRSYFIQSFFKYSK